MNFIIDILHNPPIGIFNSLLLIWTTSKW
jgi:hypothetical protein